MSNKGWRFENNERQYLDETLLSGFSAGSSGTMNERLEHEFAEKHNRRFAITANSGTSTLHMALYAFGVGPGDEVIIPALTVAMCGYVVWQCGATPVYADVREDTFLIDPADIERKITPKTKAIMPVHLYGLMCDMESILAIAERHGLFVIEDCAQCFLARDSRERLAGTVGHVGSWSFENSKHMSTGDGGIVTTDDEQLASKMRQFGGVGFKNLTAINGKVRISRDNFQDPDWERHNILAYNYRLPELCAAVGLAQLEQLNKFVSLRQQMGNAYKKTITDSDSDLLISQEVPVGYTHSYYTFGAFFNGDKYGIKWQDFRKKYIELGGDGIYAAWQTVNNEPAFKNNNVGWGEVPVAERLQKQLMQFTTNQKDKYERDDQVNALKKTLTHFARVSPIQCFSHVS
ncbi:MAG: DegT/DnrJ/EryC1/StrS family aminotransferase [Planctomycetes bacterium]|nr:DegT/DnrJ/EryC1/StrS family aminotransferase [Planctomycetota bacterium]